MIVVFVRYVFTRNSVSVLPTSDDMRRILAAVRNRLKFDEQEATVEQITKNSARIVFLRSNVETKKAIEWLDGDYNLYLIKDEKQYSLNPTVTNIIGLKRQRDNSFPLTR